MSLKKLSAHYLASLFLLCSALTFPCIVTADVGQCNANSKLAAFEYASQILRLHKDRQFQNVYFSLFEKFAPLLEMQDVLLKRNKTSGDFAQTPANIDGLEGLSGEDSDSTLELYSALAGGLEAMSQAPTAEGSSCVNDTGNFLVGLVERKRWALLLLDAFGKPVPGLSEKRLYFVGDYNLCHNTSAPSTDDSDGFSGNYCVLSALLAPIDPTHLKPIMGIQLGACMPDTCSEEEMNIFVSEVLERLGLNGTFFAGKTECRGKFKPEVDVATLAAIIMVSIIGTLMLLGTTYDILFIQWPKWTYDRQDMREENGIKRDFVSSEERPGSPKIEDGPTNETTRLLPSQKLEKTSVNNIGLAAKILLVFSVYTNAKKVLNTHQPPGSFGVLNGIRFFSMSWVVLGHMLLFSIQQSANLGTELPRLLKRRSFDAISNAFFTVDTFFAISGLLTAYVTMKEMKKKGWKINWGLFYFHRYWRLTPPYMLTILLVLGFQKFLGSGPLWANMQPQDKESCERNWWTNLLYINNILDMKDMCFTHSWYLANDMQFYWISPLMIIPLFFNKFIGMAVCMVFLMTCWIVTGVLSAYNQWGVNFFSTAKGMKDIFEGYYEAPWCRIGPCVIGIMTGYLLAVTNGKIKIGWRNALIGWAIATATGLAAVYGVHGDISGVSPLSNEVAAFYNAVSRSAWGACVCWVIVACVSGYGGFINTFLSWSPFVVLGRLTYMAYLIHPAIISTYYQSLPGLYFIDELGIALTFCGLLVMVNGVAFVLMLAFESPMVGLEKILLPTRRKDSATGSK